MPVRAWGQAAAGLALVVGAVAAGSGTAYAADTPARPATPKVGVPETGPAGLVRIPVRADAGTTVTLREGANVVGSSYATGGVQWFELTAPTGRHTYDVRATDYSGVESTPSTVRVAADATPPTVRRARVVRATPADARTTLRLTTEPGTDFAATADGLPVALATARRGLVEVSTLLADGSHTLSLLLTDAAGNQRYVDRTVEVAVPRLRVRADVSLGLGDDTRTVMVTGTPGATATVTMPGAGRKRVVLDADGRGDASFDLPDGRHPGARVRLVDDAGRRGYTRVGPFTVDTVAPKVSAEVLDDEGVWAARVTSDPGSQVSWLLRSAEGGIVAEGSFTASEEPRRIEATGLHEGSYTLRVVATDDATNTAIRDASTEVAGAPLSAGDVATGAGSVLVLVIGLGLLSLIVSAQREKVAARREREAMREVAAAEARDRAREEEEAARRRAEELAAYQDRLVDYEHAALLHEQELRTWEERRAHLADLRKRATMDRGIRPTGFTKFKLRAWEQVYCTVPGSMVEVRQRQGSKHVTVVDDGDVTVTSDRVVFSGFKRREWSLAHLEGMEHMGTDRTMMKVSTRKTWSGVTYGDPAHTRLCIALAASDHAGTRDEVVAAAERALEAHEAERPVAPEHPGPPPAGYTLSPAISAATARDR
jgi:hypothetical protein